MCVCERVCSCMPCADQRTTSSMWVPAIKLRLSSWAASDSICCPTLQALMLSFWSGLNPLFCAVSDFSPHSKICSHNAISQNSCLQSFKFQPKCHHFPGFCSFLPFMAICSTEPRSSLLVWERFIPWVLLCCHLNTHILLGLTMSKLISRRWYYLGRLCELGGRDEWSDGGRFSGLY